MVYLMAEWLRFWNDNLFKINYKNIRVTNLRYFHNYEQNMDPPQHIGDHAAMERMGFSRRNATKEKACQSSHGCRFLRCMRFLNYLQKERIINGKYHVILLNRSTTISKKKPHFFKKNVLFHKENTRGHICTVTIAKFYEFGNQSLSHMRNSQDLTSWDHLLIKSYYSELWKSWMKWM